jgi:DMSO/TMAO reductase YedYZ molybdopterin-dependent catalytic subunit
MIRATLDPATPYGRHPLQPHQLTARVTRTEDTIVRCHLGVPRLDPTSWSLTIDGLVHRSLHLTLGDLLERPRVELTSGSDTRRGGVAGRASMATFQRDVAAGSPRRG